MLQRTPPDHDFEDDGEELGSPWAALAALAILGRAAELRGLAAARPGQRLVGRERNVKERATALALLTLVAAGPVLGLVALALGVR